MPGENECKYQLYSVAVGQIKGKRKVQSKELQEMLGEPKKKRKAMNLNLLLEYTSKDVDGGMFKAFRVKESPITQGQKKSGIKI